VRFRCTRCGYERDSVSAVADHLRDDHDCEDFGWSLKRIPEAPHERVATALSNLPLRLRNLGRRARGG